MACGLTHDFNNILAAILTNAEATLSQLPSDAEVRPYLDRIAANTKSAIALTHRIQMFTENGAADCEVIDLGSMIAQVLDQQSPDVPEACQVHTDGVDTPISVTAIPPLLQESLASLIRNAVEALPNGRGHVHVRLLAEQTWPDKKEGVTLGSLDTDTCTVLEVKDNGEGIPADVLSRIFDPFFSTRLRAHGLGLVPIVGLIHSCNIALQIMSVEGQGTTVRLYFGE